MLYTSIYNIFHFHVILYSVIFNQRGLDNDLTGAIVHPLPPPQKKNNNNDQEQDIFCICVQCLKLKL